MTNSIHSEIYNSRNLYVFIDSNPGIKFTCIYNSRNLYVFID